MSSSDLIISKHFPAVQYQATETGGTYFEDVEVYGQMYRLQNATFDQDSKAFQYYADGSAYTTVQNIDGSVSHLSAPSGTSGDEITWTGNGQFGVFNVRDYGAMADGSDDTIAIQAAATAAGEATHGGIVYIPAGIYVISAAVRLASNTTLLGEGPSVSVLRASSLKSLNGGVQDGVLNVAMVANSSYLDELTVAQVNIFVRGIELQGNATQNVGESGTTIINGLITFVGVDTHGVFDCLVQSSSNDGISISGYAETGSVTTIVGGTSFWVSGCQIDLASDFNPSSYPNVDGSSIHLLTVSRGVVTNNEIGFGNESGAVAGDAINCSSVDDVVVSGNQMTACEGGIVVTTEGEFLACGNLILGCGQTAISVEAESSGDSTVSLIIADNLIDQTRGGGIAISSEGESVYKLIVADNIIIFSPYAEGGLTGVALAADGINCHHNSIDLGGLAATGISSSGDYSAIASNCISNGDVSEGGATGISTSGSPVGSQFIDNNIADVYASFIYDSLPDLQASVVRGNLGINPYGGVPAPTATLESLTPNPYPFDCYVYVSNAMGIVVEIGGDSTGLGAGIGYLVPEGGTILLHNVSTGTPDPSWVWIAN